MDNENKTISDPTTQKKLIIFVVVDTFFLVLNNTMFNVSLPDIAQQFMLLPSQLSWVVSGFIIFLAIGSVTYGRLADSYSIKILFFIGLVVFNIGSLIGFLAQWYPMLVMGRVTQAMGGAAIPALGMLITTRYLPYEIKGRVLGLISSTVAAGAALGPVIGGVIAGVLHWRFLFIISMITVTTVPLAWRYLPGHTGRREGFDIIGALLTGGAISSLLLFITFTLYCMILISVILFTWLLLHIKHHDNPFIDPSIFMNRHYRNMNIVTFFSISIFYSFIFMTPLMLRALYNLDSMKIGFVIFPGAMLGAIAGVIGGKFVDRIGSIPIVFISLTLLTTGLLLLSTFSGLHPLIIVMSITVCYIGSSLFQPSSSHRVSSTLPMEHQGIGMGMYNLFFFLASALSAALTGKLLDLTGDHTPINIFTTTESAGPFSNLFLLMGAIGLFTILMMYLSIRGEHRQYPG